MKLGAGDHIMVVHTAEGRMEKNRIILGHQIMNYRIVKHPGIGLYGRQHRNLLWVFSSRTVSK